MRHLFSLTLALYAFSVLDLHEWAHVPQSVVHWLEHHTHTGHHGEDGDHHHDEHGDHDPFGCDEHGACTAFTFVGLVTEPRTMAWFVPVAAHKAAIPVDEGVTCAHTGSKWNPPKLG